ncbi:MAG: NUDIX domain-containing protein [Alphaproteobacteria bacterium]
MKKNSAFDYEIIKKEVAFKGYFEVDRYFIKHRLNNGNMSEVFSREIFERGKAVGVILYDPERDNIVLIEQFRAGAMAAGFHPWINETVAGIIEPGEPEIEVARRETLEEAGLDVLELTPVLKFLSSPGGCSESISLFYGRVDSSKAPQFAGLESENEDIKIIVMPLKKALSLLKKNHFKDALSIISMQWLALNHKKLKKTFVKNT